MPLSHSLCLRRLCEVDKCLDMACSLFSQNLNRDSNVWNCKTAETFSKNWNKLWNNFTFVNKTIVYKLDSICVLHFPRQKQLGSHLRPTLMPGVAKSPSKKLWNMSFKKISQISIISKWNLTSGCKNLPVWN